jgi:serine/threonine protein kinase
LLVADGKFWEQKARFFFKQLVETLDYCHGFGYYHPGLKLESLHLDKQGMLKLSDIHSMRPLPLFLDRYFENVHFVPPEVLEDRDGYDIQQHDAWGVGVILYTFLAGYLPFDESTVVKLYRKICTSEFAFPPWFSDSATSLISQLLRAQPEDRLAFSDILQHPWMTVQDGRSAYHPTLNPRDPAEKWRCRSSFVLVLHGAGWLPSCTFRSSGDGRSSECVRESHGQVPELIGSVCSSGSGSGSGSGSCNEVIHIVYSAKGRDLLRRKGLTTAATKTVVVVDSQDIEHNTRGMTADIKHCGDNSDDVRRRDTVEVAADESEKGYHDIRTMVQVFENFDLCREIVSYL